VTDSVPDPRLATAADAQVWRDSLGRTWVAVGPPPTRLSDRTIREVASGTRRGTIEWPTSEDATAQGLFAARRALLEALSSGPRSAAAVPRVEGVLVSGNAIVVEHPGGDLESWWIDAAPHRDRVARFLELLATVSRSAGRLVEPAAGEGLVPVVRPRALRAHDAHRWLITEFAPLVDMPPELGSGDVLSAFLAPETVQGVPSSDGAPRVVWGIGATLLATCAWANASVDGSTGELLESPASHTQVGRLLSDLHTQGMFRGGQGGLRQAFSNYPDPHRLPTADRELILRFADHAGIGRKVGSAIIAVLDDALAIDPTTRPSPTALAERLERVARDARAAVHPKRDTPAPLEPDPPTEAEPPPEPKKKPRVRSRRAEPSRDRVVRELEDTVQRLRADLEDTRTRLDEVRTAHEALAQSFATRPRPPSHLGVHLGLSAGVFVAVAVGLGGWFVPRAPAPEKVVVTVEADTPSTASGATPMDGPVDPSAVGTVTMLGGTVSLSGDRGVYGAGSVPPGTYSVTARPLRGPDQNLGEITVHAGEQLTFRCAAGVCARDSG